MTLQPYSTIVWFVLAAVGELVGCYALWAWLREQRSPLLIALAAASLLFFAWCLTKTPVQVAGRAFAAYTGVYLVAALVWMVGIDRVPPDR
jgi:small multidrug resistance family-3 protein